ncbi:MAG: hypothetical protein HRT88_13130 [Lentisphaeraceae bacterium]|nr:hypothetical protein [Lentisphaeraceae bacterium]
MNICTNVIPGLWGTNTMECHRDTKRKICDRCIDFNERNVGKMEYGQKSSAKQHDLLQQVDKDHYGR